MLRIVKANNVIHKSIPLFCSLLFAAILALLPISAGAQCRTQWLARGHEVVTIMQRGQKYGMHLSLEQKGRVITGTASHQTTTGVNKGTVDGTLDRDSFRAQIFWANGQTGVYSATVLPSGRLDGEGYEKASPNIRVTWHSAGVLKCAPPPVMMSGTSINQMLKPPTKAAPPPPKPKPPFVVASQVIVPTPHHPFAIVGLSWDGGPDHPNVEVWVSVNNGAEIPAFSMDFASQHPIFKQPKAGIEMKLPRNSGQYRYVLKAAGKTLSTVEVYVR